MRLGIVIVLLAGFVACDGEASKGECHPICLQGFRPAPGCVCEPIPGWEASVPARVTDASTDSTDRG